MRKSTLPPAVTALIVVLVGVPVALVTFNIGPGRWLNEAQDSAMGFHSGKLSIVAILLLEGLLFLAFAWAVRLITGRTAVELFAKRKSDT